MNITARYSIPAWIVYRVIGGDDLIPQLENVIFRTPADLFGVERWRTADVQPGGRDASETQWTEQIVLWQGRFYEGAKSQSPDCESTEF